MTNDRIAEIKTRLAKLPKEPWSRETHDVVRGDNRYGSDPYNVLVDDNGKVIADSMNSDLRCIEGNCDDGFFDSGTLDAFELFTHAPEDLRDLLDALTSPPAPSGWQQRIAATDPWWHTNFGPACRFCGSLRGSNPEHAHRCLWQNAKDALPPAATEQFEDICPGCMAVSMVDGDRPSGQLCRACSPPAPSPSTVKTRATVVGTINYSEADASPAQDPIAAAVDAHLKPLGDELKAFGHKLEEQANGWTCTNCGTAIQRPTSSDPCPKCGRNVFSKNVPALAPKGDR